MRKIILVGGPRTGKSTEARALREAGVPTFCTDCKSQVKEPEDGVTYMNDDMDWSAVSQHVADNWFTMDGEWCIEGVATVRALRKYIARYGRGPKGVTIKRFDRQFESEVNPLKDGQRRLAKGVDSIWNQISSLI